MRKGKLVLTRRPGESIQIKAGNQLIEIGVSSMNGSQVRLCVQADKSVEVLRSELIRAPS